MITFRNEIPVDTYIEMRVEAGWRRLSRIQAETGLLNTAYLVSAWDGEIPVGVARVVSDMGYIYKVEDVIVIPEYQAKGIGRMLLEYLECWFSEQKKHYPTIMIDIMAAEGKSGFYEKFGYEVRTDERHTGLGLTKWLDDAAECEASESVSMPETHSIGMKPDGIDIVELLVGSHLVKGISVEIPGTGKNVLQIKCRQGLLLCGLFSPDKIDSIDFPACVFSAPEFSDMLERKPLFISAKARQLGVTEDMNGTEIVKIFEK